MYQPNKTGFWATLVGYVFTLDFDTSSMTNTDDLMIIMDLPDTLVNVAKETGGNLATIAWKDFATQTTLAAIKAKTDNLDTALSGIKTWTDKIISAPSTEAKQDTWNTSLWNIDTKVWEVQASPTSNTLLWRLKDIVTQLTTSVKSYLFDGTGNAITSTTGALDINIKSWNISNYAQESWWNLATIAWKDFATSAKQDTWNSSLSSIDGKFTTLNAKDFATETTLSLMNSVVWLMVSAVDYKSPSDFTATYTSPTTITLSALPFSFVDSSQLVYIKVVPTSWNTKIWRAGINCTLRVDTATNVVTISWHTGTAFASWDVYEVWINSVLKENDPSLDVKKVVSQNPDSSYYQEVTPLTSTAYELTNTFADVGFEIPCAWYKYLTLRFTIDINTSTGVQIRILHKHTSAGAEEYREIFLWSPAWWQTTINLNDYLIASDSDQLFKITFDVTWTPYIQVQARDDADWTGQIDNLLYTLTY